MSDENSAERLERGRKALREDAQRVRTIDITPTWSALVPIFIGVLQNDEAPVSAKKEAEANIVGMAALADKYVALVKRGSGDTVGLTPVLGDPDQKES